MSRRVRDEVLVAIKALGAARTKTVAEKAGISRSGADRWLGRLALEDIVERTVEMQTVEHPLSGPTQRAVVVWRLKDGGRAEAEALLGKVRRIRKRLKSPVNEENVREVVDEFTRILGE